jgi:hypothetical protein
MAPRPRERTDGAGWRLAGPAVLAAGAALLAMDEPRAASCPDPFAFLGPSIVVSEKERQKLDAGDAIVRVLAAEGREIAVIGAAAVEVDGDRLVAWMHRIEDLKKSEHVPAVGRFSEPPVLSDLDGHTLEDRDLDHLRQCRPGNCGLKLSADEIARMRQVLAAAGAQWRPAAQEAFRRVMLARVLAYRARGLAGIETYDDGHTDRSLPEIASMLLDRSPYLGARMPALVEHLTRYPSVPLPQSESFFYWSQEEFGGRPVTSVTHVTMVRSRTAGLPDVLVAGRQVFATHYQNGSLSLTLLLRGCPGPPHYLAYVSRSEVDVIRGLFGWLARRLIQGRVEDGAVEILEGLRDRLARPPGSPAAGAPPPAPGR